MNYEILDAKGNVVNVIVATREFVEANFRGMYIELPDDSDNEAEIYAAIVTATQQRLDTFARTRNYDGILSLCTYATSTVQKFKAEGQYGVEARDATWAKLYAMLAEVESGTRPMPIGFADVEPELPVLKWPDEV